MALKAKLSDISTLPADVQKEYKKLDDGTFLLDVESTGEGDDKLELAAVTKLTRSLESERSKATAANNKLRAFQDLDPEKSRAALAKVEEMKTWKPEAEVENRINLIKQEMATAQGTEKKALQTKLERAQAQLKKTLIRDKAVMAIQKAKGKVAVLLPHVEALMRLREQEDNEDAPYITEVINPETGHVAVGSGDGSAMTVDQLVEKFKANSDFAPAFEAVNAQGSGARNNQQQQQNTNGTRHVRATGGLVKGIDLDEIASGKTTIEMDN